MRALMKWSERTRGWPIAVRWALAGALVLLSFAVWRAVFGSFAYLPFVVFVLAVLLASALFDRGSGYIATVVAAFVLIFLFAERGEASQVAPARVAAFVLACGVGALIAAVVEAFHTAYFDAQKAHAETAAALQEAKDAHEQTETLLRESRHRLSNDLQRIVGMLRLQASRGVAGPKALHDTAARIQVLGRVHDRLSRQAGHVEIDSEEFLRGLVDDLRQGMEELKPVGLFLDAEPHRLSTSNLGAVGLILNELVTNSLKHAFPGDFVGEGAINISFRREGSNFVLKVQDNGIGDRASPTRTTGTGLGLQIVRALAAQLGGHIEGLQSAAGTLYTLTFPAAAA